MPAPKPIPNIRDSYLAFIKNSVGTKAYSQFLADYEGKHQDILQHGTLSCGYFVSSVLKQFDLIRDIHLTVHSTQKELQTNRWQTLTTGIEPGDTLLEPGDVIIWGEIKFDDGPHKHIGFYIGGGKAVSTNYKTAMVAEHDAYFEGKRPITHVYRYNFAPLYKGVVIEESLEDQGIINSLMVKKIELSQNLGWHMYTVMVTEEEINELAKLLKPGTWYMHFWRGREVIAVFKDKQFRFDYDNKATWEAAITYGKSQGIPEEQLDFPIE